MGLFDQFPYTNFHELNLMWILEALKEIQTTTEQFVAINSLKYADPIQWNIVKQYEKNTIVIDPLTGTAYISVQPVPTGVAITNTDYWTVVFDLGSFVTRAAQNFTDRWEEATTLTATFASGANDWLIWGDRLYRVISPITAGDQYVVGSNIEHFTLESIIGHLEDLNTEDKSNLVAAINVVLLTLRDTAGNLEDLTTEDKSNLVAAINEVLHTLADTAGDLNSLNTTNKSNLVAAINEVLQTLADTAGDLDSLNTTDKSNLVSAINEIIDIIGISGSNVNPYIPIRQGRLRYKSTTVNYAIIDKQYKPQLVTAEDNIVDSLGNIITGDVAEKSLSEKATVTINAAATHSSNTAMGTVIIDGAVKFSNNMNYSEWSPYNLENLYMTSDGKLHVIDAFTSDSGMLAQDPVWSFNAFSSIYKNGAVNPVIDANQVSPKTVIGQDDAGNYIVLTSGGRQYREHGLTYSDIVDVVKNVIGFNAELLYNCDGGGSSALLTHQVRQNELVENEPRKVPSMIVFKADTNFSDVEADYSSYLTDIYNSRPEKEYEINSYSSTGMINVRNLSYNNAGVAFYKHNVDTDDHYTFENILQFKYYDNNHETHLDTLDGNNNWSTRLRIAPDNNEAEILGREIVRGRHIYKHTASVTTNANGAFDGSDFIGVIMPLTATILSVYTSTNSKIILPFNYNNKWQFAVKNTSDLSPSASTTLDVTIIWIDDPKTANYT